FDPGFQGSRRTYSRDNHIIPRSNSEPTGLTLGSNFREKEKRGDFREKGLSKSVTSRKTAHLPSSHVIQLTGTIFELDSHIKETNILTKFHDKGTA
ncbi:hypothetical protein DPMN_001271, partial [Dreissena polymorpha]